MKYLKWFNKAVRQFRGPIAVMMLCHILLTCCAVGFVYTSKKLVDVAVLSFKGGELGNQLMVWSSVMVGIIVIRILLNALRTYLQTKTEINLKNNMRRRLFDVLLHVRNDGGARKHTGDVLSRMQEDVRMVSNVLAVSVPNLLGTVLQLIAAVTFLLVLDMRLALVVLVVVPIGIFIGKYISGRIRNLTKDIRESDAQVQSHLQESVQHVTLLQSMEYEETSSASLGQMQGVLYGNELKRVRFTIVSRMFMAFAFQAGYALAFLWGVFGISKGTVTYGMMTAFLQLVGQIQRPIMDMSSQIPSIIHATASIDRIMELEALPREEDVEPNLLPGVVGIHVSHITFAYPDASEPVFDDFSHDFAPGSHTAIVGHTGVGKSTLIRILLSLLTPQSGKVQLYVSGGYADADEAGHSQPVQASPATRCNLVYVPQGNSLFSGTIRENLLMGNPDADEQQLWSALHTAAADFVRELPLGLDTPCFESGAGLSEGQAQRIAIARALLRPGSILLLDEFSSALDAETENVLMDRLCHELGGHTMIFITHRDRIIDFCDSVLRLD